MKIYLFSGDGIAAGKTHAAKRMTQEVWSFASAMRQELTQKYPAYNWYNKSQAYKDTVIIEEWPTKATMRQVLLEYGQIPCKQDPAFWAKKMVDYLKHSEYIMSGINIIGIDDCRKVCEREAIYSAYPKDTVHFHVENPNAMYEPEFENEQLKALADYVIRWRK